VLSRHEVLGGTGFLPCRIAHHEAAILKNRGSALPRTNLGWTELRPGGALGAVQPRLARRQSQAPEQLPPAKLPAAGEPQDPVRLAGAHGMSSTVKPLVLIEKCRCKPRMRRA
jgi:hypothetical protein